MTDAANNNAKSFAKELVDLLKQHGIDSGRELVKNVQDLELYIAGELVSLAKCASEPGYPKALQATRDSVALEAAGRAVDQADAVDAKTLGIIESSLTIGSKVLAGLLVVA